MRNRLKTRDVYPRERNTEGGLDCHSNKTNKTTVERIHSLWAAPLGRPHTGEVNVTPTPHEN